MAEPARTSSPGPAPDDPAAGKHDPRAPGWANVRGLLCTAAEGAQLAAAELAGRPDCPAALRRAELLLAALADLAEITRRWEVDEVVIEAERDRAYRQGVADCKAARCRLEVIDGGASPAPR